MNRDASCSASVRRNGRTQEADGGTVVILRSEHLRASTDDGSKRRLAITLRGRRGLRVAGDDTEVLAM